MKINFYKSWQIGFMAHFGETYEKRKYICLDIPFLTIQLLWYKPKKNKLK